MFCLLALQIFIHGIHFGATVRSNHESTEDVGLFRRQAKQDALPVLGLINFIRVDEFNVHLAQPVVEAVELLEEDALGFHLVVLFGTVRLVGATRAVGDLVRTGQTSVKEKLKMGNDYKGLRMNLMSGQSDSNT